MFVCFQVEKISAELLNKESEIERAYIKLQDDEKKMRLNEEAFNKQLAEEMMAIQEAFKKLDLEREETKKKGDEIAYLEKSITERLSLREEELNKLQETLALEGASLDEEKRLFTLQCNEQDNRINTQSKQAAERESQILRSRIAVESERDVIEKERTTLMQLQQELEREKKKQEEQRSQLLLASKVFMYYTHIFIYNITHSIAFFVMFNHLYRRWNQ